MNTGDELPPPNVLATRDAGPAPEVEIGEPATTEAQRRMILAGTAFLAVTVIRFNAILLGDPLFFPGAARIALGIAAAFVALGLLHGLATMERPRWWPLWLALGAGIGYLLSPPFLWI